MKTSLLQTFIIISVSLVMIMIASVLFTLSNKYQKQNKNFASGICLAVGNASSYLGGIMLLSLIFINIIPNNLRKQVETFTNI